MHHWLKGDSWESDASGNRGYMPSLDSGPILLNLLI